MAVKLRLMRMGKKKQPTYRVVAADGRSPRDGRFIEILGSYDPRQEPSVILIDTAKADEWIAKGAQPTDRVRKLLDVARNQPAVPVAPAAATPAPAPAPEATTAAEPEPATEPVALAAEPTVDAAPTADEAATAQPAADEPAADESAADETE